MALKQLAPPYPIFTDKSGSPLDAGYLYFGEVNKNPETNPIQVYYDSAFTQPAAQPLRTSNGYVMRNGSPALIYAGSQFSVTVRDKNNALVIYSPVGYGIDPGSVTGTVIYDDFIGDGATVNFTLSASPSTKNATNVYIDGVYQSKDNYDVSGSTLTFSTAPPLNSAIEVVTQESSIIGGASSQQITYNQGGAGAVTRTVQSRLRDFVSVKDFGAVGDGVTDDTAAIQAAIDYVQSQDGGLFVPTGIYNHTGLTVSPSKSLNMIGEAYDNTAGDAVGGSVLSNTNTSGGHAITIDNTPFSGNFDKQIRFSNLTIRGNASSGDGFNVDQCMVFLENVWIHLHGGHGYRAVRCYSSAFRQVSFSNNLQSGFSANRALNAVHFDHCLFNGNAASDGFAGCSLSGASGADRHFAVTFTSCDFTGNGNTLLSGNAYGLLVQHASGVNVIGCYAENNYTYNLYADSTVYGLNVLGGFWQDKHVLLSEVNGLTFFGNEIYDSGSGTARLSLNAGLPDKRLDWEVAGTTYTGTVIKSFSGGATDVGDWHYTAPPTGGTWERGDKVWNSNVQNGGRIIGWVCVTPGTPGDWLPIDVVPELFVNWGDAGATLTVGLSFETNIWQSPLTADRTVTLSSTGAYRGAKFRITRTGGATGAFNLIVGSTGKNLAAGEWCDVQWDGSSSWIVTAAGTL